MALVTGSPVGNIISPTEIYVDQPPTFYFQERYTSSGASVGLLNNPDGDGFYWSLSGTTANPIYEAGCYENFQVTDVRELNMVRCDTDGDRTAIQKRNSLNITFTLKSFFSLAKLRHMLNLGPVTTSGGLLEKAGIGIIDNSKYYYIYFPSVYDPTAGDYIAITGFRVQFTNAWQMSFPYGNAANVTIQATMFSDADKPDAQKFGSFIRADASDIA